MTTAIEQKILEKLDRMEKKTDTMEIVLRSVVTKVDKLDQKIDNIKLDFTEKFEALSNSIDSLAIFTKNGFDRVEALLFQLEMYHDSKE